MSADLWLALESGGDHVSVALVRQEQGGRRVLGESAVAAPRSHARLLMPTVENLMSTTGAAAADIGAVAVALGPGSYTGLRVGIATALGLAAAAAVPTVGVPSLELAAYSGAVPGDDIVVALLAAGRGGLYAQTFTWPSGKARPLARTEAVRLDIGNADAYIASQAATTQTPRVVGPGALDLGGGEGRWRVSDHPLPYLPAAHLAALAILAAEEESEGHGQAMALAPIYLRPAATPAGA